MWTLLPLCYIYGILFAPKCSFHPAYRFQSPFSPSPHISILSHSSSKASSRDHAFPGALPDTLNITTITTTTAAAAAVLAERDLFSQPSVFKTSVFLLAIALSTVYLEVWVILLLLFCFVCFCMCLNFAIRPSCFPCFC